MDLRVIKKRIVELIPPPALALCSNPTIAPSTEITFCRHGLQHRLDQCPAYSPLTGVPDLAQFGLTGARTLAPGTRHLFPPLFQTTRLVPGPQIHDSFSLTLKPQSYASPYSFAHFTSAPDRLDCLARPKAVESSIKFPNLPTGLETCRSAVLKEDSPSSPRFSGQFCSPPLHHASVAPCAKRPRDCGARARTSASCRGSDPRRRHKQRRVGALARQNRSEARDTMEDSERFRSPINGVCILPPTWKGVNGTIAIGEDGTGLVEPGQGQMSSPRLAGRPEAAFGPVNIQPRGHSFSSPPPSPNAQLSPGSLSSASRALSLAASPAPEMTLRAAGKSPSRLELASICTLSCTVNAANSSSSMPNESAAGFAPVVSSEALAALARIENKLGDYVCRLCEVWYPDAFQLAGHKCPRMALLAYPCAYCDKVFNCPANLASHQRWHRPGTAATASGTNSYSTDKCKPRPKPSEQSRIPSVHCSSGPETILERASTNSAEPERAQDFESLQARQTMQRPDSSLSQTGEITVNSQSQEAILLPHNSKTANISLSFQLFEAVSPVRKQSDIFPSLPEHKVPIMTQHWHRQPEEALAINGQTVDKQSDPHLSHDIPHSRAIPDATRESSHPEDRNIILCSIDLTGSKQTGSVNSNERHAVGSFGNGSVSKSSFSVDALLA